MTKEVFSCPTLDSMSLLLANGLSINQPGSICLYLTWTIVCPMLALSVDKRLCPEFMAPVPIRKTRAGLQFTCAAPTLGSQDVWVCNSDGYVGQVCVLSLSPEPTVTSCNGVCNARILCIAAVPALTNS